MFHATVRSSRGALHVIGELNPYNWQTLQEHVRGMRHGDDDLRLRVEVDPGDHSALQNIAQRWLNRMKDRGVKVEVEVAGYLDALGATRMRL